MIRHAESCDISRIAEMIVVNYRINFYPFFQNDPFYFGELNVLDIAAEFAPGTQRFLESYVYDDGVVKGFVQVGDGEIWALPLTGDLKAPAGDPFLLFRASEAPWSRPIQHASGMEGQVTDGPFLWRREDGALLCLWSGFSPKGYAQGLAISDSGEIDGHFTQLPPLFLEDGGHGMLFRTFEGRLMLALHSPNTHLQERPVFRPVTLG